MFGNEIRSIQFKYDYDMPCWTCFKSKCKNHRSDLLTTNKDISTFAMKHLEQCLHFTSELIRFDRTVNEKFIIWRQCITH